MPGANDLHSLDYTEDLTQAGIAHLCRHLHHIGARRRDLGFNALRQHVAETAAELALMRHLARHEIPYTVSASRSPSSRASGILLGGRSLFLHVQLVSQARSVAGLSQDPARHLKQPVALDTRVLDDAQAPEGIHLALRVLGTVTKGPRELIEPHFLLVPLSQEWARPGAWRPLGELAFKLEGGAPLDLELGGLDEGRRFIHYDLHLLAGQRQSLESGLFSLSYLRAKTLPGGRLGVSSAGTGLRHIAAPKEWGNLWVYGRQIVLLGYLPGRDLLGKRRDRRGTELEQWRPVGDLFERARQWAGQERIGR